MYLSSVSSKLLLHDTNNWDLKISNVFYDNVMRDVSWSDDSKYILQVNSTGLVEILCPTEREVKSLQHIPLKDTWSASFHRDGHRNVAVGTKSGNVKIWDTKTKSIIKTFPVPSHPSNVQILSYNAKNTSLAATMANGDTVIYGLVSNIPVLTVKPTCSKSVSAMKFHHDSRSLLGLATEEGHVILRDITTNKDKAFFENVHASPVSDFTFSLNNKDLLLSSGYDKIVQIYDISLHHTVSTIKTSHTLTSLALNAENQVALGTKSGDILVYDLRDLSEPMKILRGHEEQVSKVAFQPLRKKTLSTEISLREEVENSFNYKVQSPTTARTSDIFFINDTPPNNNLNNSSFGKENKADLSSFLVTVGLDKCHDLDNDPNKSFEFEQRSDTHDLRYLQPHKENNMSHISTPVNGKAVENFGFPSPLFTSNTPPDDNRQSSAILNIKPMSSQATANNVDAKTVDELKEFVTLTVSDIADDNRNYFLHIMMALTKQKLYLEKQLTSLNLQVKNLEQNQSALVEANRTLTLQVEQLKLQQNNMYNK